MGIKLESTGGGVITLEPAVTAVNSTLVLPENGTLATTTVTNAIQTQVDTHMIVPTSYHIYNGGVSIDNTVITNGFSTTLYTGNGTTQSVVTGVDMTTQWGNDASETFGGLVWWKRRDGAYSHYLSDSVRGSNNVISSDLTNAQATVANWSTFTNNGFSLGSSNGGNNTNAYTYASWNFQTTHRKTGVTNHGKAYTEHYNPYTGFTIIKYTGSGTAGHEIPHSLGRKLGFVTIKNLSAVSNWLANTQEFSMSLNLTNAATNVGLELTQTDNFFIINGSSVNSNVSANEYIMYGWANSYYDENNTLIGNYEVGVYQGTGATGNKVTTRGKPAWVMIKRLDVAYHWYVMDNLRASFDTYLLPSASNAEGSLDILDANIDGFTVKTTDSALNASGGQYLYMVVYDNDSGSGKSKYPKATDTTNININALVPYANGIDTKGSAVSISYKNQTISGLTLTQGKNYIYSKNDNTYNVSKYAPMYGALRDRSIAGENPDYFDIIQNKWYSTTGGNAVYTNMGDNITGWYKNTIGATTLTTDGSIITTTWDNTTTLYVNYLLTGLTVGKTYTAEVNVSSTTGEGHVIIGDASLYGTANFHSANAYAVGNSITSGSSGKSTVKFIANATSVALGLRSDTNGSATIKWDNISVFEATPTIGAEITPRTYLDCIVYADQNGQPTYVEELPKTTYFDRIETSKNRVVIHLSDYGIAQVQTNKRYVIQNPFGNDKAIDCDVKAEIYAEGMWGETGWADNGGTGAAGYGVRPYSTSNGIIVRTGNSGVYAGPEVSGGPFVGSTISSASARIIITYKGKTEFKK